MSKVWLWQGQRSHVFITQELRSVNDLSANICLLLGSGLSSAEQLSVRDPVWQSV